MFFFPISPSKIALSLLNKRVHDPHSPWVLLLFMAMGQKAFLQPLPSTSYMHSFEKNTHNSKTQRDLMAIERGGTSFCPYSKFKSEKCSWLPIFWETMWRHPRIFHIGMQNLAQCCDFHSSLIGRCYWGPYSRLCRRGAIKVKICPMFIKPLTLTLELQKQYPLRLL